MTTPDTSAVRSWARDNGFDVADRGRLPAEVVDAYTSRKKGVVAGRPGKAAVAVQQPAASTTAPAKATPPKVAAPKAPAAKKAGGGKPAASKPAASKPAAARQEPRTAKAAPAAARKPRTAPKPTPRAAARSAAPAPVEDPTSAFADASLEAITADPPVAHAKSAGADDRLAQLADQVRALTDRVAALEGGSAKPGKGRFRRQR